MRLLRWRVVGLAVLAMGAVSMAAMAADPFCVDLSSVATPGLKAMFGKLEVGKKDVDGIPFNVSDTKMSVKAGEKRSLTFPPTKCAALHFLHFTENYADRTGTYILSYEDGQHAEIAIKGGFNISDWWKPGPMLFAAPAHEDVLANGGQDHKISFWRFSARNPRPDVAVTGIEVINADAVVTINLIALTLTETCEDMIGKTPVWANGLEGEPFLLAILKQPGDIGGKEKVCEQLKVAGTAKSVPVLASYLQDEKLGNAARLALAAMQIPEAKDALRDALAPAKGEIKAGIVESLGVIGDPAYVELIAPLLRDSDGKIAMSAALALGRIGGPAAIEALKKSAMDGSGRFRMVVLDALLRNAEALCGKDDAAANALYTDIYKQWGRGYMGVAAYRGMVLTAGANAPGLVSAALLGTDPAQWDAAIPAARQSKDPAMTKACVDLVPQVSKALLPNLIEVLAQRGDKAATPGLVPLVSNADPAIATAAIRALGIVGDGTAVPELVKVAARGDEACRAAAVQTLTQLNAPDVSPALLASLQGADAATTTVVAKVVGARRDEAVAPNLRTLVQSQDAAVRTAAVQALAEIGGVADTALFCEVAEKAQSDKERAVTKRALVTLGQRLSAPPEYAAAVIAALAKDNVPLRCALLDVCGRLANPELLKALDAATADAAPEVKDAALRALADTENPQALPCLLALIDKTPDLTQRVLVFRGIAKLASDTKNVEEKAREEALLRGLAAAERPEDKKLFLGALGTCHTVPALKAVESLLPSNEVVAEAVMAWGQIAKAVLATQPDEIRNAAPGVAARAKEVGLAKEATAPLMDVMRTLAASPVTADKVHFEHIVLDPKFRSEGVAVADVNRDGINDIIAGDFWFEGPDWKKTHEIQTPGNYDPKTGYSRCFANFAMDVDDDGWIDSVVIGFPGAPAYWYRNPGTSDEHWKEYLLATSVGSETPIFGDLLGDGKPVLMFIMNGRLTWFRTGQDKLAPWLAHPIAQVGDLWHGLGMGDVNKDGRMDYLCPIGWWEGPADPTRPDWPGHGAAFGDPCADMVVYDVNGDGMNDVITSSAHNYGIWWFEQKAKPDKTTEFEKHEIFKGMSQTHSLILADINNDGLQDFVTGKRYYAHCGHDPGCEEPALLCWFELVRPEPGKVEYRMHEIDKDSGVGTQFKVCDLDEDGLQDVVTSNKKGVHVFLQRRSK